MSIGLVSCASRKRNQATAARDLYVSALFLKSRAYIESRCDQWFILSARHGVLDPDTRIAPYNESMSDKSRSERERWAIRACLDLRPYLSPNDEVVILAGVSYREFLAPLLADFGCSLEIPMEGMGIGKQLQWLNG